MFMQLAFLCKYESIDIYMYIRYSNQLTMQGKWRIKERQAKFNDGPLVRYKLWMMRSNGLVIILIT